jgi:uncharacterized protein (DUF1810 family)
MIYLCSSVRSVLKEVGRQRTKLSIHDMPTADPYNLNRFVRAQSSVYLEVLSELKNGAKASHWMWFVFPQIKGLGRSPISIEFAISSLAEARAYLCHPVLGPAIERMHPAGSLDGR